MKRFSIFEEMIESIRIDTADVFTSDKNDNQEILYRIREALLTVGDVKGIAVSRVLKFSFIPLDSQSLLIDSDKYENIDNITMNYGIKQTDNTKVGSIESKALWLGDKQIVLISVFWKKSGTIGDPTIDISFDKDVENGEELRGTFLANESLIEAIVSGKTIDTSMITGQSFSLKWNFPINSDYEIKDTIVRIVLVDSSKMIKYQYDISKITSYNILKSEAIRAAKVGQSDTYIEMLNNRAESLIENIKGKFGNISSPVSGVYSIDHDYDRNYYADRGFRTSGNEEWVAIIGNDIVGKVIRKL